MSIPIEVINCFQVFISRFILYKKNNDIRFSGSTCYVISEV